MTDILENIINKIKLLESQVGEMNKKINVLQEENQELKTKLILYKNDNFKRPASVIDLDCPSIKKFKYHPILITPEVKILQENKPKSEGNCTSSQRRQVMKEIVKDFHSNILPRYQDHLNNERNLVPKLRSNDGRIILKNIRYIR